jgi:hypothetical protein
MGKSTDGDASDREIGSATLLAMAAAIFALEANESPARATEEALARPRTAPEPAENAGAALEPLCKTAGKPEGKTRRPGKPLQARGQRTASLSNALWEPS